MIGRGGYSKGLGQPTDYASYIAACMGSNLTGAVCIPTDSTCTATQANAQLACYNQYLTDPNSPHNSVAPTAQPTPILNSPTFQTQLAAAGGSIQLAEAATGQAVPITASNWWTAPGANVTASPLPANFYAAPTTGPLAPPVTLAPNVAAQNQMSNTSPVRRTGTGIAVGGGTPASAPTAPQIVQPSPATQVTNGTTAGANPNSALSQFNGQTITPLPLPGSSGSQLFSTVGGMQAGTMDIIPGVPNLYLLIGAGALVLLLVSSSGGKK